MTTSELGHQLEVQHNYGYGYENGDNGAAWDEGAQSIIVLLGILSPVRAQPFFEGMYAALDILQKERTDERGT